MYPKQSTLSIPYFLNKMLVLFNENSLLSFKSKFQGPDPTCKSHKKYKDLFHYKAGYSNSTIFRSIYLPVRSLIKCSQYIKMFLNFKCTFATRLKVRTMSAYVRLKVRTMSAYVRLKVRTLKKLKILF